MGEAKLALKINYTAHPTAIIAPNAKIGAGTRIWAFAQVREDVVIGKNCMIGNGAYIDAGVRVGDRVNIHNKALLYRNLTVEDDVFIGPGACFVNDPLPRANRIRDLKGLSRTVKKGASVGANTTVLPEINIGRGAMVGAGSLVSYDVPDQALVYGVPAKVTAFVDASGKKIKEAVSCIAVRKTAEWLLGSGIQDVSDDGEKRGGVSAWYDGSAENYPYLYSEITGYALSAFAFLYRLHPEERYLHRGELAAHWLTENALTPEGGIRTRFYLDPKMESANYSFNQGRVYAFDASMVGYGLLQLYRATQDKAHLKTAEKILDFMKSQMTRKDGSFHPYWEPGQKSFRQDLTKWSDQSGSFHAKHALFYVEHYRVTGDEDSRRRITIFLDKVVKSQETNGRFITAKKDKSTLLHPHAYTLEGLLYAGVYLGREDYARSARRGFEWMCSAVGPAGNVASTYKPGGFVKEERSDIVAQLLRIGAILYSIDPKASGKYTGLLQKVKDHLLLLQQNGKNKGAAGGFRYSLQKPGSYHTNSWCTMFALQALWMHDAFVFKRESLNMDSLI